MKNLIHSIDINNRNFTICGKLIKSIRVQLNTSPDKSIVSCTECYGTNSKTNYTKKQLINKEVVEKNLKLAKSSYSSDHELKTVDVAKILNLSISQIKRIVYSELLAVKRTNHNYMRFKLEDVEKYIDFRNQIKKSYRKLITEKDVLDKLSQLHYDPKTILNIREVAFLLKISLSSVRNLTNNKLLICSRDNSNERLFTLGDVNFYTENVKFTTFNGIKIKLSKKLKKIDLNELGKKSDSAIARKYKMANSTIHLLRNNFKIPPFQKHSPKTKS